MGASLCASASAQSAANAAGDDDLWARSHLLGFGPGRQALEENGIQIDGYFNAFLGWNTRGGVETDEARYSHSVDLFVRGDTEGMGLWSGGSLLLQVKNNVNQNINPAVGSLSQVVDDADFDETIYIDQLYYEHRWGEETGVRFRAGYLDYQTIIDRNAYANSEDVQFMNAALDNNPFVPLKIGFGATLFVKPADWLEVVLGTADAENEILQAGWDTAFDDEELMAYGEVTLRTALDSERGELPGGYRFGVYYDPRERPEYDEMGTTTGTVGVWVSLDQRLYREKDVERQGLGVFYRYGYREGESFPTEHFHSAGFEYLGPLPNRDEDAFGVAFYDLVSSDEYRRYVDSDFGGEWGLESYYRVQLSPWLAVTPGVQYITDPGGDDSARDSLAFVLRTRFKL